MVYTLFTEKKERKKKKPFLFFCPDWKMLSFLVFCFFFSVGICCYPAFAGLPNNFTIFLCICDVPILTWVILTKKSRTQLHVWETTVSLYWVSGVMPAETLTLCNVISVSCLFCHLSLFFFLYPGEMLAHLVKEVCDVCGRGLKHLADVSPCASWSTRTLLSPI